MLPLEKKWIQMHRAGDNRGYLMYAYLQCEFSNKPFYKPSFLWVLYLQVFVNQTFSAKPAIYHVFYLLVITTYLHCAILCLLVWLLWQSCQPRNFERDLLSLNTLIFFRKQHMQTWYAIINRLWSPSMCQNRCLGTINT